MLSIITTTVMNWIMLIASGVSTIHIFTILSIGTVGIMILSIVMDMVIIRDFQWPGIGVIHPIIAGILHTHIGDGDILHIIVTGTAPITEDGDIIIRGMEDTVAVIMAITGMRIQIITVMENVGLPEQMLSGMTTAEEEIHPALQQARLPATKVVLLVQTVG